MLSEPVPADWYPVHLMKEVYQAVDDEFTSDDPDSLIKMGRFVAEASIKGFLRYLARLLTVEQLIKRVGRFWKHYHKGGSIEAEEYKDEQGRKKGVVRIYGYPGGEAGCKAIQGYIEAILAIAGARELRVEKKTCIHKGDDYCSWDISWEL